MASIPKPKHCGQNWLDMTPTEGGRICGQCEKKIVDFSKASWTEIEALQKQHNQSLCGMYHPKQLEHWGTEVPKFGNSFLKAAAINVLTVSLTVATYGQNTTDSLIIEGMVLDRETGEQLPFAQVRLINNHLQTVTDIDGNFKLVLNNIPSAPMSDVLEVVYPGYSNKKLVFDDLKHLDQKQTGAQLKNGKLEIDLSSESEINAFYVHMPSRKERFKQKIRSWFRKSD